MVLELGPCPVEDVRSWSRFARRILVELRACHDQQLVNPDVIDLWAEILDDWSAAADRTASWPGGSIDGPAAVGAPFRWSRELEPEMAEFLLDGLDRCLNSPKLMGWVTVEEAARQRTFTAVVVRAFLEGLAAEGQGCRHFADHINQSLGRILVD
jgi:hypothetical protein